MTNLNLNKSTFFVPEFKKIIVELKNINSNDLELNKTISEIEFYLNYPIDVPSEKFKKLLNNLYLITLSYGKETEKVTKQLQYFIPEVDFIIKSTILSNKNANLIKKINSFMRSI